MKNMPAMEEEAGSASRRFVGARAARASLEGLSGYRGGTDSPRWEGTLIGVRTSVGLVTGHKKGNLNPADPKSC